MQVLSLGWEDPLVSKFAGMLSASSFKILNSSAEILSPPLALFVVMLPKAHFTLQDAQL